MDSGSVGAGNQLLHVDIHIDEHEPCRGILDLLSRLRPHWKAQDIQMKTFTEGITNQLIGCYVGSLQEPGCVLVRLYGRMTELYVNRDREVEMFQVFHAHGCGPQIYCSFQNGICYEFVRGTVLDDELLRQPSIYRLIAAEMGRIHSIQPKCGLSVEPLLWTKMSHFLTLVQSSINSSPAEPRCTKRGHGVRGERGPPDTTKKQTLGHKLPVELSLIGQMFNLVYVCSEGVGSPSKLEAQSI